MDRLLRKHFNANDTDRFADRAMALARKGSDIPLTSELLFDFAVDAVAERARTRGGYVYVATNPLFPQLCKIGLTRLAPEARMRTLSSEGLPVAYILAGCAWFPDRYWAEAEVHRRFADRRVTREFFELTFGRATREVKYLAAEETRLYTKLTGLQVTANSLRS